MTHEWAAVYSFQNTGVDLRFWQPGFSHSSRSRRAVLVPGPPLVKCAVSSHPVGLSVAAMRGPGSLPEVSSLCPGDASPRLLALGANSFCLLDQFSQSVE